MRSALSFVVLAAGLVSCKSPTPLSLDITAGLEKDAFTADPAVTQVTVAVTSLDNSINRQVSAPPGGTFDLGNIPADQQIGVEVTGVDAAGKTVMRGRSLYGLPLDSVDGGIEVFAQRTGAWARPPDGLKQTHVGGVAAILGEQYILLTGGAKATKDGATADPSQVDFYDLFALGGTTAVNKFPRVPDTIVSFGSALFLIDAAGASWLDFSTDPETVTDTTAPSGLGSFADVAGGVAVASSDGRVFIVGGTRSGTTKTGAVLEIDTDGTLSAYSLAAERVGASATWIDGVGLVVAGGSDSGPGVEVLGDGAKSFVSTGYPADPVQGAGAVINGTKGLALIGGTADGTTPSPTRLIDPSCTTNCTAQNAPATATLPVAMDHVAAYSLGGTSLIAVGDEAGGGFTRAFQVDLTGKLTELPLKEKRRGAVPVPTPLANLAIVGGEHEDGSAATSVEMFFIE